MRTALVLWLAACRPGDPGSDPAFVDVVPGAGTGSGPAWWLIGVATIIVLVAAIPLFKRIRRRRRLARIREGDITAVWDEIVDRLVDLRIDVPDTLTPMEIARRTDPSLVPVAASYGSTVYGGRTGQARESDLYGAEWWMDRTFDTATRARAAVSLRSLTNRR